MRCRSDGCIHDLVEKMMRSASILPSWISISRVIDSKKNSSETLLSSRMASGLPKSSGTVNCNGKYLCFFSFFFCLAVSSTRLLLLNRLAEISFPRPCTSLFFPVRVAVRWKPWGWGEVPEHQSIDKRRSETGKE